MKTTRFAILSFMLVCGTAAYADTFGSDPILAHDALLGEATGYFAHAGGTGGQGGEVVYVTNLNDSGPGSLREAAESIGPKIILFENGLSGTINVNSSMDVELDKTIWGRHRDGTGANIFISPASDISAAFRINGDSGNIIISNFFGDAVGPDDSAPDWITIRGPGGPVWVSHITFDGGCGPIAPPGGFGCNDMDGVVDVKRVGVTIDHLLVKNWDNVSLIRPFLTGDPETESLIAQVTLHHNLYRNNNGRQPSVSAPGGFAHAYNNWVDAFRGHGMQGKDGGQVRAENNIFSSGPDEDEDAIRGDWAGSGNVFLGLVEATPQQPGIFTPPYAYALDPTGTQEEWEALQDYLEANAGWQPFAAIPDGDFDFNGEVNGLDFLEWQRDPSIGSLADWKTNYGMIATLSATSAAVPEPTTSALALAALCLAMSRQGM